MSIFYKRQTNLGTPLAIWMFNSKLIQWIAQRGNRVTFQSEKFYIPTNVEGQLLKPFSLLNRSLETFSMIIILGMASNGFTMFVVLRIYPSKCFDIFYEIIFGSKMISHSCCKQQLSRSALVVFPICTVLLQCLTFLDLFVLAQALSYEKSSLMFGLSLAIRILFIRVTPQLLIK